MELTETVIGSQEIYSGRIVHLRVDAVRLPDGRTSQREIVGHRGAVCIVAVTDNGEVIMVRQFRLAAGRALLEVPAGTLDEGEEPIDCAARELEEETGFRATRIRPMFSAYLAPGYSSELIHAFLATGLTRPDTPACTASISMDSDENLEVEYVLLTDLEAMILRGELQDSKSISSILTAAKLLDDTAERASVSLPCSLSRRADSEDRARRAGEVR